MIYKFHKLYAITHIITGISAYYFPIIWIIIIIYQLVQLCINKRFFLCNKNCIRKGNNIKHTLYKLSQYLLGYAIIEILTTLKN